MSKKSNLLNHLLAEKQIILKELANDPSHKRLEMIEGLISEYGIKSKKTTKTAQIHDLARKCIVSNGGFAKKAVIAGFVEKHGIKINANLLGVYLQRYDDLKADRNKGYSIKK